MKSSIAILLCLFLFHSICVSQVKISDMPTRTGNPNGAWVPIVVGSTNYKTDAANFGWTKMDSAFVRNDSIFGTKNRGAHEFFIGKLSAGIGSGSGIMAVYAGYGLLNVDDSTLKADSATLALYFLRRKDSSVNGGYYPYATNPKNYLTSTDTGSLSNRIDLKVDSATTNSDSSKLYYWVNGASHEFYDFASGLTGGDTTVFQTVIDSTGQPGQRVLWAGANHKISSNTYLLYDSALHKLVINWTNISIGGPSVKLYVRGNAFVSGNLTANSFIKIGGTSSQFLKADGSVDNSIYLTTAVTSVATNTATGIMGGTITTSGTLFIDTTLISTRLWRQKGIDSVGAFLVASYGKNGTNDSTILTLNNGTRYAASDRFGTGTVTSVATNNGTGITGGTITSTGTLAIDTNLISTRAWRQKGIDSVVALLGSVNPTFEQVLVNGSTMATNHTVAGASHDFTWDGFVNYTISTTNYILFTGTNTVRFNSLDSASFTASNVLTMSSARTSTTGTSNNFWVYRTGTSDSLGWQANSVTSLRAIGLANTTSTKYKPFQIDTTTGTVAWKLIDVSSSSQITGTLAFTNGGLGFNTATNGDILYYNSGWQKLAAGTSSQTLHGGSLPSWKDTTAAGGAFYSFAAGGTATGQNLFTFNTSNWNYWNGTYTAGANYDAWMRVIPTITNRSNASDISRVIYIKPTITTGGASQVNSAIEINLNGMNVNGKATTAQNGILVVQPNLAGYKVLQAVLGDSAQVASTASYIQLNGSGNWNIVSTGGATQFGSTNVSGINILTATELRGILNIDAFTNNFGSYNTVFSANNTTASLLFGGASSVQFRTFFGGTGNSISGGGNTTVGSSLANTIFGKVTTATATSGTHAWIVNVVIDSLGAITNNGATVTNSASLYIDGAKTTGATNNWAFYINAGSFKSNGRLQMNKGADVASAGDLTLGTDGNIFHITGTTTINAIITSGWTAGSPIFLIFDGALTVKNNTAGGAGTGKIILKAGADLSTAAGTTLMLWYDGTSFYQP